ncbi:MAG: hypothetical protein ACI9OJ_003771 [Myxococcota bacterium]
MATSRLAHMLNRTHRRFPFFVLFAGVVSVGCTSKVADEAADATSAEEDTATAGPTGGLSFTSRGNDVTLTWSDEYAGTGRTLEITQGETVTTFDVVDGQSSLTVPTDIKLSQIAPLMAGAADWAVTSSDDVLVEGSMTIVQRFTSFFNVGLAEALALEGLDGPLAVGVEVTVNSNSGPEGVRGVAYIGTPSGGVDVVALDANGAGNQNIPAGQDFSFKYTFAESGVYAVEVNLTNGIPAVNVGVYVGDGIPFARALLDEPVTPADQLKPPIDVASLSAQVLARVNTLRAGLGLNALVSHPTMEQTAQQKAQSMADDQYFGHVDKDGKRASDLAVDAGIMKGNVSENIALDYGADRVFDAWYWSPSHRRSLINPDQKSHGFGAAVFNSQFNQLSMVQHFLTELP